MNEIRLGGDSIEVVVLPEAGARLHRLRVFGHDLLRTPDDPTRHRSDPFYWGAYVMAPWCNRLDAQPTPVGDRTVNLAPNFRDGTAIHGQAYDRPWERTDDGSFRLRGGGDGWPWPYEASFGVATVDTTLRLDMAVTNLSDDQMPAGIGIHPWFRRPLKVAIHAEHVHTSMVDMTPEGEPVRGAYDLRTLGDVADDLDATWSDPTQPPVELAWPEAEIRATMRTVSPSLVIVAASPANIDAIAVEPQTHLPQGLRRTLAGEPGGLAMVVPGGSLKLRAELAFERG